MRFPGRVIAATLVCLCGLAQAASAQSPQPELRARFDTLYREMLERPADLDLMFEYAALAQRIGEYEQAIATLERVLIYNPDLPEIRLELAELYLRVGGVQVARSYAAEVGASATASPEQKARAAALVARAEQRSSRHQIAGSLFGGIRYQTNANAGPDNGTARIGGTNIDLDDRFRREDDFNVFLAGTVLHRYDLETAHREAWETRALAYGAKQFQVDELDLGLLEVQTGPRLVLFPGRLAGVTVRPFALANIVFLDEDFLFSTLGGGIELERNTAGGLGLRAAYTLRYKDFYNSSSQPIADEQSGFENEFGLAMRYRLSDAWEVFGDAAIIRDSAKKDFNSNVEFGAALGASYAYAAPFGLRVPPWQVTLSGGYIVTGYDRPDPSVDPGRTRFDEELRLALTNSFRIDPALSIELQGLFIDHESNLPNYDRDNWSFLLGALWLF